MLLCSGRTYSPDHLDIESKLDLILKELQDLRLRVEGLENKNTGETSRENRRVKNTNRCRDGENDIIHRVKIDQLTFNRILDLKIFSDWTADLDYYFDWYRLTEESRVWFARMRLLGSARIY